MAFRKYTAAILVLVLTVCLFPFAPAAGAETTLASAAAPPFYASAAPVSQDWNTTFDRQALRTYLFTALYDCPDAVDISSFGLHMNDIDLLLQFIQLEIPEVFQVDLTTDVFFSYDVNQRLQQLYFSYHFDAATYHEQYAALQAAATAMTADLKTLGEVEKVLLIHDRLALSCCYRVGEAQPLDYTAYGALVKKTAVCQGYALAYQYLLEKLELESEICTSATLNHSWNIVTIKGERYHVDVTWDDPLPDIAGRVNHDHFLRSSSGIFSAGHTASDYDTTPTDTTYDHFFWQDSHTAFQLADGDLYYIDNSAATVNRYHDRSILLDIEEYWMASPISYYPGCFSRLSSDGTNLLFSLTDSIYWLDPISLRTEVLYHHENDAGQYLNFYGFQLEENTLTGILSSSPNFSDLDTITPLMLPYTVPKPAPLKLAVLIMRHLIGLTVEIDFATMDQNMDQKITIADAVQLLRSLVE